MTAVARLKPLLSEDAYAFVTRNQPLKELSAHEVWGNLEKTFGGKDNELGSKAMKTLYDLKYIASESDPEEFLKSFQRQVKEHKLRAEMPHSDNEIRNAFIGCIDKTASAYWRGWCDANAKTPLNEALMKFQACSEGDFKNTEPVGPLSFRR